MHEGSSSFDKSDYLSFLFFQEIEETSYPQDGIVGYLKFSAFAYSLTNMTSLAIPFILKDTLLLSPSQLGLFSALCAVPSFVKPICALIVPPARRPAILVMCSSTQAAMFLMIGTAVANGSTSIPLVCGCMFVHSIASAVGMYIRDSMTVEATVSLKSESAAHALVSDLSMIARIGLLPASYLSGYLLSYVSPANLISSAAIFPTMVAFAAIALEQPLSTEPDSDVSSTEIISVAAKQVCNAESGLFSTVTGRGFFMSLVPSYTDAMFFYYTQELGFSAEFLGRFQFFGAIAGILGNAVSRSMWINPQILSNISQIFSIPIYGSLILITSHHFPSWISVGTFVLFRHALLDFCSALTNLPSAVQLMRTAPKGAEGSYLALVGTMSDFGGLVNSLITAGTLNFLGLSSDNLSNITSLLMVNNVMSLAVTPLMLFYGDLGKKETDLEEECEKISEILDDPSPRDA